MEDFILYFKMGLNHVLDFQAYDHILFLIVLVVVFNFNQWKKTLLLITFFTVGHSITLALAAYGVISFNLNLIEFLIPVTILITGITNVFRARKTNQNNTVNLIFALFFGLIHGLGFSNYFRMMVGKSEDKLLPLTEFAIGIEAAQIIIVLIILIIGSLFQNLFRVTKRDWILVTSSIVIGFSIQMIIERYPW